MSGCTDLFPNGDSILRHDGPPTPASPMAPQAPPQRTCFPMMTASCAMMAAWLEAMLACPWSIRSTSVLSLARAWARALERSTCGRRGGESGGVG